MGRSVLTAGVLGALALAHGVRAAGPDSPVTPAAQPQPVSYRNHKLVAVDVSTPAQLLALEQIGISLECVPHPGRQRYVIPPEAVGALDDLKIPFAMLQDDVQQLIDGEKAANEAAKAKRDAVFYDAFRNPAEIDAYLNALVAQHPDLCAKLDLGLTLQGRHIVGIRIQAPASVGAADTNPAFLIEAQQHAREWISPMVAVYTADRLASGYGVDPAITALVNTVDWYIVPTVNVDGYQYTIDVNRLWRKNRRANPGGEFGVDLNRNWSVGWSAPEGGNSTDPGNETYRGPAAFSEPESVVMRDFMQSIPRLKGFVDLHSYGEQVLAPWGYTIVQPPRSAELTAITSGMLAAINSTFGLGYIGGPTATTLYVAAGTSNDFAFGTLGVTGYGIELRDTGASAFELPPDQIMPSCIEAFNGLEAMAGYLNLRMTIDVPNPPATVASNQSTTVGVSIVPYNLSPIESGSEKLFYRVAAGGGFTEAPLLSLGANGYSAIIPPIPCGQSVQYYIEARAGDGTMVRNPAAAPGALLSAKSSEVSTLVADSFDGATTAWAVNLEGTDTATSGRWNRMAPQATTYQPGVNHTPEGTKCWVTDGNAGPADGSFDVDGGRTTLYSPLLDLSATPAARIGYWRWFDRSPSSDDSFIVSISSGGGYFTVETIGGPGLSPDCMGGWRYHEFRPSDFVTPTSTVRLRFLVQDLPPGHIIEAALDDYAVFTVGDCALCTADLNGDGVVNTVDLAALLAHFGEPVPPGTSGDLNADGVVNTNDLAQFLSSFGNSCP